MKIRLGTRGSRLALAQTALAEAALREKFPGIETERVILTTRGDRIQDRPLSELGGAGAFSGELESALIRGEIDIAVHSAKDLGTAIPSDLAVGAVLRRGDPREVFIPGEGDPFSNVGTGSVRRRAGFLELHPEAAFSDIRGNVETRLRKLREGRYSGIILAAAGLERLGLFEGIEEKTVFGPEEFLPAPCQAIIALENRAGELGDILGAVNDGLTYRCFLGERRVLELLGGGCDEAIAAYCRMDEGQLALTVTRDQSRTVTVWGEDPVKMAWEAVREL